MNLWCAFRRSFQHHGERPAVTTSRRTWTYRELGHAVAHTAGLLERAGVGVGDRVVLLLDNDLGYVATDIAITARGAVKTPLNMMMSAAEVLRAIQFVEPTAIVLDAVGRERCPDLPEDLSVIELAPDWAHQVGTPNLPPESPVAPDEPAGIFLSGGTTGLPKGIVHSQSTILHNLWAHLIDAGIDADSKLLVTTPLPHSAGLFVASALLAGAHVHIESGFDAARWISLVEEHHITWSYGVPTMLKRILDLAEPSGWSPSSMRTFQYGSAPMSPGLLRRSLAVFGPVLQQLYAQTECPQYATLLRKSDHMSAVERPDLLSSAGRATTMCEVSIRDAEGRPLDATEAGEVCLRSPYVMTGYWKDPAAFSDRFHGDWLRTGDVGYMDSDGYLFLLDRLSDMVISGGMNVFSIEVEAALSLHPAVAQAAVIGVPDEEWGERVHAVVVLRDPAAEIDLAAHCREHLAAYKRPKSYDSVDALPLTTYGKVDKKALRRPYWPESERLIH